MNSESHRATLRTIVRRIMNKATLAYVVACNYDQPDIDRVADVKEDEQRVITEMMGDDGLEYQITIDCMALNYAYTTHIPLLKTNFAECPPTKSTYLIGLAKALAKMFKPTEIDPYYAALYLAKELNDSVGYRGMLERLIEDKIYGADEAEVAAFIESALMDYIEEVLS